MKEQQMEKSLRDLIEIIHFTEKVSTKIHGVLDEASIYRIVREEFGKSNQYTASIVLLTTDGSGLKVAEAAVSSDKLKAAEKASGLQFKKYTIDLDKSSYYRQVVKEGKTIQAPTGDIISELFPRPVAFLVVKLLNYTGKYSILAPLRRHGKIIGALAMTSTELVDYFIPSVNNLAQHISNALELANEYAERKKMEKILKESEIKYRTIFENITDVYYRTDLEGTLIMFSPSGLNLLGYESAEEVVGKNIATHFYYNSEDRKVFLEELKKKSTVKNYEITLKRKDGTPIIGETNSRLIFDEQGNPVGVEGMFRDITERRKAEEMLKRSEEKYKSLIENLNVGVYRVVPDGKGQLVDVNQALMDILGYKTKEDVLALSVSDTYFNLKDRKKVKEKIFSQGYLRNEELTLKRKDGTPVVVSDTGKAVYDTDGTLLYFDGVLEDITERKRIEEELEKYRHHLEELVKNRTSELTRINEQLQQEIFERKLVEASLAAEKEQLSVTLRSIGDGVITTDTEGTIVLINRVAEQLTGWTQEEAVRQPLHKVFTIISEKTRFSCENPVEKVLSQGVVVGLGNNTVLISRDGTEQIIADSGAPIRDKDSNIIGVVLVFRDVTEKRKMEQDMLRTQKLESISILAGGIAHDFNNILTAVLTNANLAKMYTKDTQLVEKLTKIEKASLQAKELTQQLLTFSRGGAPIRKATSIGELIKDSVGFALRGSNVRCHFYLPDDLWAVDIDEGQISQVINNLIINADQSMPEGGIIQVRAENEVINESTPSLKKGHYVKISIIDQGIGIPEKYLTKVFDPYFSTKQKGSGLGLATSYSIVKQHDGHIDTESEVGAGSTFTLWLPAAEKGQGEEEETPAVVKGKGRVLLMDDEESVREAACEVLEYLGYTVVAAETGEEAIDLYKKALPEDPFEVVIMDLTVPGGMGGKEALSHLLKVDPQIKAIVASGYSTDPIMANYRAHGFKGVVAKPYSIEDLSRTLQKVLQENM